MDFENIKKIKLYADQIKKFRKLDKFKNMKENVFYNEMKNMFPSFEKNNKIIFKTIIENKNLHILDIMFKKLNIIENEYNNRKSEINEIKPIIEDIKLLIKNNEDIKKDKIINHLEKCNKVFIEKYPVIIDRLLNKETKNLKTSQLLLDQIKYKHEIEIGNILAQKYVYPNI